MEMELSSLADLERAIAAYSSERVYIFVAQLKDLCEAGPLLHRLKQIHCSPLDWNIDEDSLPALLEASNYCDKLEELEFRLGLLKLELLDIEDGVAVRLRRNMLAQEHENTFQLLDTVTVEAHEMERFACLLGFIGSLQVDDSDDTKYFADVDLNNEDGKEIMKAAILQKIEGLCQLLYKIKRAPITETRTFSEDTLIKGAIVGGGVIPHIHESLIKKAAKVFGKQKVEPVVKDETMEVVAKPATAAVEST